ncbi:hypothetical protein PMAYCL1PPCAC_19502 [Pristionchus mayeri]|uniref:C-type lectin n=1 Tax=Pristionchus mayeri TaxID=1317129 RepID=A0AAN5CRM4_9BILA|nr:hypothetical protein PMAYCL1PPCAC_19502 [Pristionchus mayeri]
MLINRLLAFSVTIVIFSEATTCSDGFFFVNDRCIKRINNIHSSTGQLSELLPLAIRDCAEEGGLLPIIRNAQENAEYNDIAQIFNNLEDRQLFLALGMVCNTDTTLLVWEDSSPITFVQNSGNPPFNLDFNCLDDKSRVISRVFKNDWYLVPETEEYYIQYMFLCESRPIDEVCCQYPECA